MQAAPSLNAGVKQVENIDEYIVVHSPTTTSPVNSVVAQAFVAAPATAAETTTTVAPAPEPAPVVANVMPAAPAAEPAESESQNTVAESDDSHETDSSEMPTQSGDHRSGSGTVSHDHHHSDDGHESDDHQSEGGDD